jgi:hypothetical protein
MIKIIKMMKPLITHSSKTLPLRKFKIFKILLRNRLPILESQGKEKLNLTQNLFINWMKISSYFYKREYLNTY